MVSERILRPTASGLVMRTSCFLMQAVLLLAIASPARAQTMAALQGRVLDPSGAAVPGASVEVQDSATGFTRVAPTDAEGRYHAPAIPAGVYQVTAEAAGFRSERIDALTFEVGRTLVRDFQLAVDTQREVVVVSAELPLLDRATSVVGHVVSAQTVQEMPLNGRHFVDLGPLVPGSVASSQTGFSTTPIRGTGALAFNTTGNREEAVAYIVNGVTTTNLTFGSISFPPPVASIQEFKIDNSTFSAEYGHVSGAIVNLVTRSGTDQFRAEAYEFFRNDALDARNFFEFTTLDPHPFERNQFGGTFGGPILRSRTFFLATYEGLRQRQGIDMNGVVPSDAQRDAAVDPVVRRLIPLIPRANYFDADGTPRFVGAADARVDENTWTSDVRHNAGKRDRLLVFFGRQRITGVEPTSQGTSIPGFGQRRAITKTTLTVNETHMFGAGLLNEARFGRTMQDGGTFPATALNPVDFGIVNGVTRPLGLPQMVVAGALSFGGPATLPQGRNDTLYVFNDTLTYIAGRHTDEGRRRGAPLSQQQLRGGHRPVQFSEHGRVPLGHRQRVQHHARRAPQPHHAGCAVVLRAGLHRHRPVAHRRSRAALRMAHDAHGEGQSVRGLRRGHRLAGARGGRRRQDLSARTTPTSSRASAWRGHSAATAAPWCAPLMARRSTSQARRRSTARRGTRRLRRR